MSNHVIYPVIVSHHDGGVSAELPDFPSLRSGFFLSIHDLQDHVHDLVQDHANDLVDGGSSLPIPTDLGDLVTDGVTIFLTTILQEGI